MKLSSKTSPWNTNAHEQSVKMNPKLFTARARPQNGNRHSFQGLPAKQNHQMVTYKPVVRSSVAGLKKSIFNNQDDVESSQMRLQVTVHAYRNNKHQRNWERDSIDILSEPDFVTNRGLLTARITQEIQRQKKEELNW